MTSTTHHQQFAVDVVVQLRSAGYQALFAGGCVRDLLLGRPAKDFDVATTARPDQVRQLFGHKRTVAVGASFGVIMVLGPRAAGQVEVATFRKEGEYIDGRHPSTVEFCTPEEDAARRDFTINGMFLDPVENQVLDYVGGQVDLAARVVRAIGDPHQRIREDKLRMLRAVRFAATLDFTLHPVTADAIRLMAADLVVVSAERIAQELKKMLIDPHRRRAIELAEDVRLLHLILPELDVKERQGDWIDTLRRLEQLKGPSFELATAALLMSLPARPQVHRICRRLKLSNDETDRIVWLVEHQSDLDDAACQSLAPLKRKLSHPYRDDLLQLMEADCRARSTSMESVEFCQDFLVKTPAEEINPPLLISGDDLVALGMKPGPRFKLVLDKVRDAQLNLEILSRDQAIEMAVAEWNM